MDARKLASKAMQKKATVARKVVKPMDLTKISGMGLNENSIGMSRKAKEAIIKELENGHRYGDFQAYELKTAIAEEFNLDALNILTSMGSSPIIGFIAETFLNEGDELITCVPTFNAFEDACLENLATPILVELTKDTKFDLDGMISKITDKTKVIVVCNPNNPTATYVGINEIEEFINKVPDNIVVVFDEAYIEYATAKDCVSTVELMKNNPEKPIIVLRTFSKFYGLAGIRAGYALAQKEIIDEMVKCCGTWNLSRPAQVGAVSALHDREHSEFVLQEMLKGREFLEKELTVLGCEVFDSQTNFLYFNAHKDSKEVFDKLLALGVHTSGGHKYNRVTVATMPENEFFIKCMKEIM